MRTSLSDLYLGVAVLDVTRIDVAVYLPYLYIRLKSWDKACVVTQVSSGLKKKFVYAQVLPIQVPSCLLEAKNTT